MTQSLAGHASPVTTTRYGRLTGAQDQASGAGSSPGRLRRAGRRLAGSRGPGRAGRAPGLDVARGSMPAGR